MSIWAHTMFKNEARWLWYSVTSVIDFVDKILLWDTGSTDGSDRIAKELKNRYKDKIIFSKRHQNSNKEFKEIRQEMLNETNSAWFLMLDADEIWWRDSITKLIRLIKNDKEGQIESVIVPTINTVGDIFHYQEESAGKYKFGNKVGHYNLRAIRRNIPGLHSEGVHGTWGWADDNNKMIQDRSSDNIKYVNSPYLHTTFLPRASNRDYDKEVFKRAKKFKHEIGKSFPKDFYFPESFFNDRPDFIQSPWKTMGSTYKFRSFVETPLRKINRMLFKAKVGY